MKPNIGQALATAMAAAAGGVIALAALAAVSPPVHAQTMSRDACHTRSLQLGAAMEGLLLRERLAKTTYYATGSRDWYLRELDALLRANKEWGAEMTAHRAACETPTEEDTR